MISITVQVALLLTLQQVVRAAWDEPKASSGLQFAGLQLNGHGKVVSMGAPGKHWSQLVVGQPLERASPRSLAHEYNQLAGDTNSSMPAARQELPLLHDFMHNNNNNNDNPTSNLWGALRMTLDWLAKLKKEPNLAERQPSQQSKRPGPELRQRWWRRHDPNDYTLALARQSSDHVETSRLHPTSPITSVAPLKQPIELHRRTEELIDGPESMDQLLTASQGTGLGGQPGALGDFASQVSLMTSRKQLQRELDDKTNGGTNDNWLLYHLDETMPLSSHIRLRRRPFWQAPAN